MPLPWTRPLRLSPCHRGSSAPTTRLSRSSKGSQSYEVALIRTSTHLHKLKATKHEGEVDDAVLIQERWEGVVRGTARITLQVANQAWLRGFVHGGSAYKPV